ncbi:hypothetical protein VKT23_008485 [Stygiomarasmius scandens]|uniref:MYND-type domain-containing protein n=1 Tax=Marasmiellus scandens TaxID=2682957 RepID=A0ABR1JLV9_9AGAR
MRFTLSNFENRWSECEVAKEREKWILEGLVTTDLLDPSTYRGRQGVLSRGHDSKDELPVWRRFLGSCSLVGTDAERIADEDGSELDWDMINSSVKKDLSQGHLLQRNRQTPHEPAQEAMREAKNNDKEMAARLKQQKLLFCHRRETLLACQKCREMGRYVYYCSRDCQVNDWKRGILPHKTICGSTSALADSVLGTNSPSPAEDTKWGAPGPGFTRSLALLYQLKVLDKRPNYDYMLVRSEPELLQILLYDLEVRPRNNFFSTRCVKLHVDMYLEVEKMYDILLPFAMGAKGVGKDGLKQQLKNEYGVDIGW